MCFNALPWPKKQSQKSLKIVSREMVEKSLKKPCFQGSIAALNQRKFTPARL
jgi:hypothetical protein